MAQPLHPSLPYHGGAILSPPIPASSGLYQDVDDHIQAQRMLEASGNQDLRNYRTTAGVQTGQSLAIPVRNQGQTSSCTAFAGCYVRASLSARYHLERGEAPEIGDVPSPRFAYKRIREIDGDPNVDQGASMRAACQVYVDYGVSPERFWPWDAGRAAADDLAWLNAEPSDEAKVGAQFFGASGWARLSGTGSGLLASVLACMADGYPPLLAINVFLSFEQTGSDGRVTMPKSGERVLGGHAIAAYASWVDQSFPGGGAVLIENQWTEGWANGGWALLPWQYFLSGIVMEAETIR